MHLHAYNWKDAICISVVLSVCDQLLRQMHNGHAIDSLFINRSQEFLAV